MLPVFQVGPLAVRAPEMVLLAGLWLGLEIASRAGGRRGLDPDRISTLGFWAALGGALAARAGFVGANFSVYRQIQPASRAVLAMVAPSPGTEIEWIGLIAAGLIAAGLIRLWKLPALDTADAVAPGLAALAAAASLANLFSGEAYGIETALPWGIDLWGARRHPIQIYSLLAFAGIGVALWRRDRAAAPGTTAQLFLILAGLATLLIEPLRADSPLLFDGVRAPQVFALIGALAGLAGFAYRAPPTRASSGHA